MKVFKEVLIIIVLGVVPIIAAYFRGGIPLLMEVMKGLMAQSWLMYYTMVCGIFFVVFAFLDYRIIFRNKKAEKVHNVLSLAFYESASAFVGILRVTSGILISCPFIWVLQDFNLNQSRQVGVVFIVGIVAGIESYLMNIGLAYIHKNWIRSESNIFMSDSLLEPNKIF